MLESEQINMRQITQALILLCTLLNASFSFAALEVDEFDLGTDGWTIYPANIGRTTLTGWKKMLNDGENAIAIQPTNTKTAYYWRLTKTIDLGNLGQPQLEIKYLLPGLGYDQFKISVAPASSRRQSDFVAIYEQSLANPTPQTMTLDLSAYRGQEIQVQFSIRKPTTTELNNEIGFYLHKIALKSPPAGDALVDRPNEIRVASFNVQVFGLTKISDPLVMSNLVEIFSKFDLIFMQEIRDKSGNAILTFLNRLNERAPYQMVISERLGRTASKEQYAYIYRSDKIRVEQNQVVGTQMAFERPPYLAKFSSIQGDLKVWTIGLHADPDHVVTELNALHQLIASGTLPARASDEALMIMGDFNADCDYLRPSEKPMVSIFQDTTLTLQVSDDVDTTTTPTNCAYDRLFTDSLIDSYFMDTGLLSFDQSLGLAPTLTKKISDHYPIWIRLSNLR